jgi:hypothetical protein
MRVGHLLPLIAATLIAGCGPTTKYNWGGYSQSLYSYHRNATQKADYEAALEKVVASESPTTKVPPGIFAELGYLKLSAGNTNAAVKLFEREKTVWPEATVMMDRAIASARGEKEKTPSEAKAIPTSLPTS